MLNRRGFTLAEMLVAMLLALVVLGTATTSVLRQQRVARRIAALGDDDAQLRAASALLTGELATLDATIGDLATGEASDTAIQLRATVATSIACAREIGAATLVPVVAGEVPLGGISSPPRVGDSLWWFPDSLWIGRRIASVTTVTVACAGPVTASGRTTRVSMSSADTIEAGTPLRLTRPVRYAWYRGSDGWSLGYREWNEATQRFVAPQPAAGPLLQRGGGRQSGFRYFDSAGTELFPAGGPIDVRLVARVRTTALALIADREAGQDSVRADSLDVAVRHASNH